MDSENGSVDVLIYSRGMVSTANVHCSITSVNVTGLCFLIPLFFLFQTLCIQEKVIFEEDESDDGEEVDQNDGKKGCQQNGATVSGHGLHHIQQGLLAIDHIK